MTLDRLYRWLLSCYPAEFRLEYREEMLLLYHERSQAEPRLALWIDLVADLFRTAPKEHLDMIWNDLLYAFRALRKTPVVTAAVVATLALALGANTAIFSVVQSILLNPLPYADGSRLVRIWESNLKANQPEFAISVPNFVSWRERAQSFSDLACWRRSYAVLVSEGETERISTAQVSGAMFRLLGYRPILGRGIALEDENPSAPTVAVLSHRLWSTRYGSDPQIVGKQLTMPGGKATIVGVVPTDTEFFRTADLFVPVRIDLAREPRQPHNGGDRALARRSDTQPGAGGNENPGGQPRAGVSEIERWLECADGERLPMAGSQAGEGDARGSVGRGCDGAADRVRQHFEPPDGPRGVAASGDGGTLRARSRAVPVGAPPADRDSIARRDRRRIRRRALVLGRLSAEGTARTSAAASEQLGRQHAGDVVLGGHYPREWPAVRHGAGVAGIADAARRDLEIRQQELHRKQSLDAPHSGGRTARARDRAGRGRRPARDESVESAAHADRLRPRPSAGGPRRHYSFEVPRRPSAMDSDATDT